MHRPRSSRILRLRRAFVLAALSASGGPALAQKATLYDVAHVAYDVQSGPRSNGTGDTVLAFRHEIRFPEADWLRLDLADVALNAGDAVRLLSLTDGLEQEITRGDPQYGGTITSIIFSGGNIAVELHLAPGSQDAMLTIRTALVARLTLPETICGATDDRMSFADPCAVRIVDSLGAWGSGFMISPNWMVTAAHVMTDGPWTVQADVQASTATGAIQPPLAAADQFSVPDPPTGAFGVPAALGNDWAVIDIPDNAFRSPGANCQPQFNCTYGNTTDGTTLRVDGFGIDLVPPQDNGVLQRDSGPSVPGGNNPTHFRYRVDTMNRNSGSRVTDGDGRIVGIHTNGGCLGTNPETDANSGTLITNAGLQRGIQAFCGECPCGPCTPPHFQCYEIKPTPFLGPTVSLVDRFGAANAVLVQRPERLCAPADKNDEEPTAPAEPQHLTAYRIRHPFSVAPNRVVVNQFGTIFVDITRPDRLLVPSTKSLFGPPSPLTTEVVDHFRCYKIRRTRGTPPFTPIFPVKVDDQFGTALLTLSRPFRLCAPVDKSGEQPEAATHPDHLLCYKTTRVPFPTVTAFLDNQFGPQTVTLIKRTEFCVPSLVSPTPGSSTSTTTSTSTTSTSASTSTTTTTLQTACCDVPPGAFGQALPVCFDAVLPDVGLKCQLLGGTLVTGVCDPDGGQCVPGGPVPPSDFCCECPEPSPPFPHPQVCFEGVTGHEAKCQPPCLLVAGLTCGPVSERCGGSPSGAFVEGMAPAP